MAADLFLALDLMVRPGEPIPQVPTIADFFRLPNINDDAKFQRWWNVFPTAEAANEYAAGHPTIVVMPLVIEFNPELGY